MKTSTISSFLALTLLSAAPISCDGDGGDGGEDPTEAMDGDDNASGGGKDSAADEDGGNDDDDDGDGGDDDDGGDDEEDGNDGDDDELLQRWSLRCGRYGWVSPSERWPLRDQRDPERYGALQGTDAAQR